MNYASSLVKLERHQEAEALMRKMIPVARRVHGEGHRTTLAMRLMYARALCRADGATLGDTREAVARLEDAGRIARRVLGGAYPLTVQIENNLGFARETLRAREEASSTVVLE